MSSLSGRAVRSAVVVTLVAALSGCGLLTNRASDEEAGGGQNPSAPPPAAQSDPGPSDATGEPGFDLDGVETAPPLSGQFPYFSIPDGYANPNSEIPVDDYGRIPFWNGVELEWVEGRVYQSYVHAAAGENFSSIELKKLVEDLITGVGGVPVTDSKMTEQAIAEIDDETAVNYVAGFGDIYNQAVVTYVVKTSEQVLWIHLCATSASASWMIVEAG